MSGAELAEWVRKVRRGWGLYTVLVILLPSVSFKPPPLKPQLLIHNELRKYLLPNFLRREGECKLGWNLGTPREGLGKSRAKA
jgi:hypothetical protein